MLDESEDAHCCFGVPNEGPISPSVLFPPPGYDNYGRPIEIIYDGNVVKQEPSSPSVVSPPDPGYDNFGRPIDTSVEMAEASDDFDETAGHQGLKRGRQSPQCEC